MNLLVLLLLAALVFALVIAALSAIRVVQQYERGVIFVLGRLIGAKGPGLFLVPPFISRMSNVDLRIVTLTVPPQEVITRDNVTIKVTAVLYFYVVDPIAAVVNVVNFTQATTQIGQTTLRNVLGQSELDELLAERKKINRDLQAIIDEQTERWGVKVTAVEIKDVELPATMQRAMAKQKGPCMTNSPQMVTLLPMTVPFSERLSETWLLERTYHAHLRNERERKVPALTLAMKQLNDVDVPLSLQSSTSHLAERLPLKKSTNFSVPLSTWSEISQEEARATYQQGMPVLLYGEHAWDHPQGAAGMWGPNTHMRIIFGNAEMQPAAVSGTDYAVCYLDRQRGAFSNPVWKAWVASDPTTLLESSEPSALIFLGPWVQFPYTTHYTVIAADGQVHAYATSAEAIQGFQTLPPQEVTNGSQVSTIFPQFCYYHEVTCPSGVYRLEFFGSDSRRR